MVHMYVQLWDSRFPIVRASVWRGVTDTLLGDGFEMPRTLEKCRASRSEWSVSNLSPEDTVGELGVSAFGDSPFHPVSAQKLR